MHSTPLTLDTRYDPFFPPRLVQSPASPGEPTDLPSQLEPFPCTFGGVKRVKGFDDRQAERVGALAAAAAAAAKTSGSHAHRLGRSIIIIIFSRPNLQRHNLSVGPSNPCRLSFGQSISIVPRCAGPTASRGIRAFKRATDAKKDAMKGVKGIRDLVTTARLLLRFGFRSSSVRASQTLFVVWPLRRRCLVVRSPHRCSSAITRSLITCISIGRSASQWLLATQFPPTR